jgi:hypothetical protein
VPSRAICDPRRLRPLRYAYGAAFFLYVTNIYQNVFTSRKKSDMQSISSRGTLSLTIPGPVATAQCAGEAHAGPAHLKEEGAVVPAAIDPNLRRRQLRTLH